MWDSIYNKSADYGVDVNKAAESVYLRPSPTPDSGDEIQNKTTPTPNSGVEI